MIRQFPPGMPFDTYTRNLTGKQIVLQRGKAVPFEESNELTVALNRRSNGKSPKNDLETANVQFVRDIVANAKELELVEKAKPRVPKSSVAPVAVQLPRKINRGAMPVMRLEFAPDGTTTEQKAAFLEPGAQLLLRGLESDVRKMLLGLSQPGAGVDPVEIVRINRSLESLEKEVTTNHPLLVTVIPKWSLLKAIKPLNTEQALAVLNALPALREGSWLLKDQETYDAVLGALQRSASPAP
ncbi:hypothetical protein BH11PSE7_BH11PSE7_37790 [soil metagenome]